jgi:hypothetical protein
MCAEVLDVVPANQCAHAEANQCKGVFRVCFGVDYLLQLFRKQRDAGAAIARSKRRDDASVPCGRKVTAQTSQDSAAIQKTMHKHDCQLTGCSRAARRLEANVGHTHRPALPIGFTRFVNSDLSRTFTSGAIAFQCDPSRAPWSAYAISRLTG